MNLRREQEAPLVAILVGNRLVDEQHLGNVGESGIIGNVVQPVAERQESGDVLRNMGGHSLVGIELGLGGLGVVLGSAIVEEMPEDIFEHSRESDVLAEPLFGIGSGYLLGALLHHLVSKAFGEFLNALLDDAKALGLPGFVFGSGLKNKSIRRLHKLGSIIVE